MDMFPRKLPVFDLPVFDLPKPESLPAFRALPEGYKEGDSTSDLRRFKLPEFDKWNKQKYFIDVFLCKNLTKTFTVNTSDSWIKVNADKGELVAEGLRSQQRIWVEIDWANAPSSRILEGNIIIKTDEDQYTFVVAAKNSNELVNFYGHIESNRYLSINAADFSVVKTVNHVTGVWWMD